MALVLRKRTFRVLDTITAPVRTFYPGSALLPENTATQSYWATP